MLETAVDEAVAGLKEADVRLCAFLPDSWLASLEQRLVADPFFRTVPVTNEGEGVSVCAGAWLGGVRSVMLMENSGLRMASEELARLGLTQGIPVFMLMSYRGDHGDKPQWAQSHAWTMEPMLRALRADYRVVRRTDEVRAAVRGGPDTQRAGKQHVAVVFGIELCEAGAGQG